MHALLLSALLATPAQAPAEISKAKLVQELNAVLKKHDVPALGVAVLSADGVVVAASGVRKRGDATKATDDDLWHLGSDSKAMTAMLLAILVNKKLVCYDSTLAEVFPELKGKMHADYRSVTVEQLLRHRAGLPANLPGGWGKISRKQDIRKQREQATATLLSAAPEIKPGTKFQYSNAGYTLAGHVAERVGGASWEDLMHKHVFGPLGMKSAGFGAPGTAGAVDQPWPHTAERKPVEPGPFADNPPVMGPAGRVHCSLEDWAKFAREVMRGAEGKGKLLPAAAYKKLVEPADGETYTAGGWLRGQSRRGYTLGHDGDNTMNHCSAVLYPKAGVAVLVVCNQGSKDATEATDAVRRAVVGALFAKE